MSELKNRVALVRVTGGSRDIGKAIALAASGAAVNNREGSEPRRVRAIDCHGELLHCELIRRPSA
jgi:NAD(P)-dependent dehydrogenase (short-subunit alcohol dehydrogenase family)